jgi:hypothetical protein
LACISSDADNQGRRPPKRECTQPARASLEKPNDGSKSMLVRLLSLLGLFLTGCFQRGSFLLEQELRSVREVLHVVTDIVRTGDGLSSSLDLTTGHSRDCKQRKPQQKGRYNTELAI